MTCADIDKLYIDYHGYDLMRRQILKQLPSTNIHDVECRWMMDYCQLNAISHLITQNIKAKILITGIFTSV